MRRDYDDEAAVEACISERSPLTKHSDSAARYGILHTPSRAVSDDDDDLARSDDEETLIASSPVCSTKSAGQTSCAASLRGGGARSRRSTRAITCIVLPMLLAVFISNADSTIVMATHAIIASDFMALESSSWLFTGFMLASTATYTTFGQLSEIYGRKPVMVFCYFVFGLGCLIAGAARSMGVAIAGRVLSGAVSAGTNVLVSLVITDLLPVRHVATWRSYVNVVAVSGRCVGGPLGGWLADAVGWRLSFVGQAPVFLLAIVLCCKSLPNTRPAPPPPPTGSLHTKAAAAAAELPVHAPHASSSSKLGQVDLLGAVLLGAALVLLILPLELGGRAVAWTDARLWAGFGASALAMALFAAVEKGWARSPMLPLGLFGSRHTVAAFVVMALQTAAQLGMMFSVPLYFQVTQRMSSTLAGTRLLPAVVGNAMGGILAGHFIKTTGKYKWLIVLAALLSALSYSLLLARWHGSTGWLESLYIFPGGFGTGVAFSAIFIAVQASIDRAHLAPAVSTLYLAQGFGGVLGLAASSAVCQAALRSALASRLRGMPDVDASLRDEVIQSAVASVDYVYKARGDIAAAVVESYVQGLWYSHFVSLLASLLALLLAFLLREYRL